MIFVVLLKLNLYLIKLYYSFVVVTYMHPVSFDLDINTHVKEITEQILVLKWTQHTIIQY